MKTKLKTLVLATLILAAAVYGVPAQAAEDTSIMNSRFGVVDMGKVIQSSQAAKGILADLEGRRKEYQTQIKKEEETLNAAEKEIIKQKETLSAAEFDKKRVEFQKKLQNAQKMVKEKKETLDDAFSVSMDKLRIEATKVIADVAREKGYHAVLNKEAVIMAEPEFDMTEDVIARLNKAIKKIPVEWTAKKK